MKVLMDTNVVLDVLLDRRPFSYAASEVFALIEQSKLEGILCATTVTTLDYLLIQSLPRPVARQTLRKLLELFEISPVTRAVLEEALQSKMVDFEDAVLDQAARLAGASLIVTRNQKDFKHAVSKVYGPEDLLVELRPPHSLPG
jgi:predicted nucleic acid-binding protein